MAGLTASEMMYEAKVLYESMASADAPGFTPREWSVLLTQAQEKLIKDIYAEGIDKDEFNRRAVSTLLNYGMINSGITSGVSTTGYANSWIVPLTTLNETVQGFVYKPLFYFEQRCNTNLHTNVKVKEVEQGYPYDNEVNPYKKPYKFVHWQLPYKNESVIVITDGGTVSTYYCAYIKKPYPIIVPYASYTSAMTIEGYNLSTGLNPEGNSVKTDGINCRLHESTHRKIVSMTAEIAKATNKDQLALQLQKLQENT